MILKLERPIVFFDLETTGLNVEDDRVVEFGMVKLMPDGARRSLVERVDPGRDIPEQSAKVHGIRTEEVRGLFGKPPLSHFAGAISDFTYECDLGGFNCLQFDVPLWRTECARHGIRFDMDGRMVVDAKTIFNTMESGWDRFLMGPRNLGAAVRHFCGRDLEGAHSAGIDAEATIDVLLAQLERYPDLPRDVPGLHAYCAEIHQRSQAEAHSKARGK